MEKLFKIAVLTLLLGILVMLVAVYTRLPGSLNVGKFALKEPLEVEITNPSLEVEVSNSLPINVDVQNSSIDVEVRNTLPIDVNVENIDSTNIMYPIPVNIKRGILD